MRLSSVRRIIGLLVTVFSLFMLPPYLVAIIYGDGESRAFGLSFILILLIGLAIWRPKRNRQFDLRLRDGFLVVALFWVVLGLLGALPFLLARSITLSPTDAIFESISGLTTTGATVMSGLDALPHAILFYRQQLQWFGGMGIIVLAVAVLPMLGVGGMQLYRAETPGPVKDNKLTPRITETAKSLWLIYLLLTIVCAAAYFLAGMGLFDAICHSFSTVSIGGFSPHDASIGYFDSRAIEWICILFMFIAGINFSLHFVAWRQMNIMQYIKDPEFNAYVVVLSGLIILVSVHLWWA
ncbi:MAG: potassium transporter, partial [Gammaproteobacteria bacterium]|nr:potassium transporter [Gammaproteobacteria bacterium]